MIVVISPAKSLNFDFENSYDHTLPKFQREALELIDVLKEKSEQEVRGLMDISEKLAVLNVERYHNFTKKKDPRHARQALFAFQGDVYQGLQAATMTEEQIRYTQDHLRILSGLYGLLKPLDLIQPYRLEMGTSLAVNGDKNLYGFWKDKIAQQLNKELAKDKARVLLNLASQEYFRSVNRDSIKARIVDVEFKDFSNGEYKVISFYAKKARGLMTRYVMDHRISEPEELQLFNTEGYAYDAVNSEEDKLVFKRG